MEGKVLDLTGLSDMDIARLKSGFSQFQKSKGPAYFGAVTSKKDVKCLNKLFGYMDWHAWLLGAIFALGGSMVYFNYRDLKKLLKEEEKEEK